MTRVVRALAGSLVAFAAAVAGPPCLAGEPDRPLSQLGRRRWTTEDGLPQSAVRAVLAARDGYLWLGTAEGAVRFDGVRFTTFDRSSLPEMASNNVVDLAEGADGTIWMATFGGGLVRLKGGTATAFTVRQGLPSDSVLTVEVDSRGGVWAGTYGGGACRLEAGAVTTVSVRDGLPSDKVIAIHEDRGGAVWLGTSRGLARLAGGRVEVVRLGDGTTRTLVHEIAEDRRGVLWVATNHGLVELAPDGARVLRRGDGLCTDNVPSVHCAPGSDTVWAGTDGGLNRVGGRGVEALTVAGGVLDAAVSSIASDAEGNVWLGTKAGLVRLQENKLSTLKVAADAPGNQVRSVLEARDGTLWVSTGRAGVVRIRDGGTTRLTTADGLPGEVVESLHEDPDGTVWLGASGGGLGVLRGGRLTRVLPGEDALSLPIITCLLRSADGTLWVGTSSRLLRIREGRLESFGKAEGFSDAYVTCMADGDDGRVFVGTDGDGLFASSPHGFLHYSERDGLPGTHVVSLYRDAAGALWIGTFGNGLSCLRDGRFGTVTARQGLPSDVVSTILEDDSGTLWMSCNRGLFAAPRQELAAVAAGQAADVHCRVFDRADGMQSSECDGGGQPLAWKARDGRLLFATMQGVVVVDPAHIRVNTRPPPVVIEEVLLDGEARPVRGPVEIAPGRHRVEVRFTALSLSSPEKVRFRFRLEGFDAGWVEAGGRREATYTNLPPGSYRFRVVACNADGVWNEAGASCHLSVAPYLWETGWFTGLVAAGALALLAGGVRLRVHALRRRQAELERLVHERTGQLEQAVAELAVSNRQLERLTTVDTLTGISNRRHLDAVLGLEWRRGYRAALPLALVMIDIDHFKGYNDALGHQAGDECLRVVAGALASLFTRAGDVVARYGGEEFLVVLPATSLEGAAHLAEQTRAAVEALQVPHPASSAGPVVTISLGVAAAVPTTLEGVDGLLHAADHALLAAKQGGRNRVVVAPGEDARATS